MITKMKKTRRKMMKKMIAKKKKNWPKTVCTYGGT